LRHPESLADLRLSRNKTFQFLDGVLTARLTPKPDATTTVRFFRDAVIEQAVGQDGPQFAKSLLAAVNRYYAEPDFTAFSLLLENKLPEWVVKDNQNLCSELLEGVKRNAKDSKTLAQTEDCAVNCATVTKQKFFFLLQNLLPHKPKRMWQDMQHYFPAGGPDHPVPYEWLLSDDMYLPSPVTFGLRQQHLEEVLDFFDQLEKDVHSVSREGFVSYRDVTDILTADTIYFGITDELLCHCFNISAKTGNYADTNIRTDLFLSTVKKKSIFFTVANFDETLETTKPIHHDLLGAHGGEQQQHGHTPGSSRGLSRGLNSSTPRRSGGSMLMVELKTSVTNGGGLLNRNIGRSAEGHEEHDKGQDSSAQGGGPRRSSYRNSLAGNSLD